MKRGYSDKVVRGFCASWDCNRQWRSGYRNRCWTCRQNESKSCLYCTMVGKDIKKHICSRNLCDKCGFGHNEMTTCINKQCPQCELWFRCLPRHLTRCKKRIPSCVICGQKVRNMNEHIKTIHPIPQLLQEMKTVPLLPDITNIIASYAPYEKMYQYCPVCLKKMKVSGRHFCAVGDIIRTESVSLSKNQVRKARLEIGKVANPEAIRNIVDE